MKEEKDKKTQNRTVSYTIKGLLEDARQRKDREKIYVEQERTRIKKKVFLEYWAKTRGVVSATCERIGIGREAFYRWKKEDEKFADDLKKVTGKINEEVKDMLMGKIMIEKDGPSIRYWLDRKDPEFKPKAVTEIIAGERTLEDLIAEDDRKIEEEQKLYDERHKTKEEDKRPADKSSVKDKNKEGGASEVHTEQSPKVLSKENDEKKPDTKS